MIKLLSNEEKMLICGGDCCCHIFLTDGDRQNMGIISDAVSCASYCRSLADCERWECRGVLNQLFFHDLKRGCSIQ